MAKKATFEEVRARFESKNLTLIDTTYINSRIPLRYKCNIHSDVIQYKNYGELGKSGCKYCAWENNGKKSRKTFHEVKTDFEKVGLILLEKKYEKQSKKLKCVCPKHDSEILEMTHANVSMGHGCKYCAWENNAKNNSGENNGYFKGGVSPLNIVLRKELKDWRMRVLRQHNFKCFISGKSANETELEVHHIKTFHEIRDEILQELGFEARFKKKSWVSMEFTNDELEILKKEIVKRHNLDVGIPLTKELHKEFHTKYGKKTKPEDFFEFAEEKQRYNLKCKKSTQTGSVLDED